MTTGSASIQRFRRSETPLGQKFKPERPTNTPALFVSLSAARPWFDAEPPLTSQKEPGVDAKSSKAARDRRYHQHRRGNHAECLPDRPCRPAARPYRTSPPPVVPALSADTPGDVLAGEILLVRERLAVLGAALEAKPLDIATLAEVRGQQRTLVSLLAAKSKHAAATPPAPMAENPLEALRRRRAERMAGPAS